MHSLSVAIITYNEEKNIEQCIRSVKDIADEIIVVDSFSTDLTPEICKKLNVTFIQHPFEGHIQQKNYARLQCSHNLVLSLDADEALSEELRESIINVKKSHISDGYTCNRRNHFCGTQVNHSGWYPDKSLRLWNKNKGEWGGSNPHDKFIMVPDAKITHLNGDLLHYTTHSVEQAIIQINKFSTISAQSKFEKNKKSSIIKIILFPVWRFTRNYFLKAGFLDGLTGFIICKNAAYTVYLKYLKLYYLQNNKGNKP
ncbi:MAG: glycosyltransferase family 2 protein [Bacteroidota bacterium]